MKNYIAGSVGQTDDAWCCTYHFVNDEVVWDGGGVAGGEEDGDKVHLRQIQLLKE